MVMCVGKGAHCTSSEDTKPFGVKAIIYIYILLKYGWFQVSSQSIHRSMELVALNTYSRYVRNRSDQLKCITFNKSLFLMIYYFIFIDFKQCSQKYNNAYNLLICLVK